MNAGAFILRVHSSIKKYWQQFKKNETREIRLSAFVLEDEKTQTIFEKIQEILDTFNLWNSIKMMVYNTISINSGKIQNYIKSLGTVSDKKK